MRTQCLKVSVLLVSLFIPMLGLGCDAGILDDIRDVEAGDEMVCETQRLEPIMEPLKTSEGDLVFDAVAIKMTHREGEPGLGCVNSLDIKLQASNSPGCTFHIVAADKLNGEGQLQIESVHLKGLTEQCGTFPEGVNGSYVGEDIEGSGLDILGVAQGGSSGCYTDGIEIHLRGTLRRNGGNSKPGADEISLENTTINLTGTVPSRSNSDSCPQ